MTLMPLQAHSERVEKGSDRWIAQLLSFISSHRQQYLRNTNSINAALNQVRQGFINELELH